MKFSFRRFFFWFLVFVFLGTAPIAVFYAIGYRYNIERGIFIYSGSLTVQSNPTQNVDIHINGISVSSQASTLNQSYTVSGLKPGKYQIDVSAPGFSTWSKEALISSGIATEFWNVLLTRNNYAEKQLLLPSGSTRIFPSPDASRFAILILKNGETIIDILDAKTNSITQVFSSTQVSSNPSQLEQALSWSGKNDSLLLAQFSLNSTNEPLAFLVNVDTFETTDLRDVTSVSRFDDARWNPNQPAILFLSDTTLFEVATSAPWTIRQLADHVEAFDTFGSSIATLQFGTSDLFSFPASRPENRTQITSFEPEGFRATTEGSPRFSVIAYDKTRIALLKKSTGECFLYNNGDAAETFSKLPSNTRGLQFSDDGKKILLWTDWEIFAFFTRKWNVQPIRNEGDRIDVGRFSKSVDHVQWSKDYEHVLFSSGNSVNITELDGRGGRNVMPLLQFPTESPKQVLSIGKDNIVYFLISNNATSDTLPPTPTVTLSSINFPEPSGFFGIGG